MKDTIAAVLLLAALLAVAILYEDPDIDWRAAKCKVLTCRPATTTYTPAGWSPAGGQPNPFAPPTP